MTDPNSPEGMESENTRRFSAAVNSRTAEENARILGVPVEELLRAGFVDTPAETERRQREFFRGLSDGARDGWRSVSLDHWVLLDGDNVMAWVSRVYQGADGEWGWRVARCNGGTDVMVQPCEGTSGDPETLAGAKAAAEAAMSLGSAYDLGLSRAWGQRWEAQRERVRETVRAHIVQAAWATVKTSRADADRLAEYLQASQPTVEFVADPADAVRLCMNAVAAAQDALATARAAVEHAVKLGAGETLRAIVGEAARSIGEAVRMPNAASEMMQQRDLMQTERDEARAGWAEQTADAARLRIALQEAQQQLVQAHEDIDALRAGDARGLTLNTSIKVKLSEETAAKIYAARVERGVPEQYAGVPADGEGWSRWQVWTFAQEVGPYLHPLDGMPCAMEIRRA